MIYTISREIFVLRFHETKKRLPYCIILQVDVHPGHPGLLVSNFPNEFAPLRRIYFAVRHF